MYSVEWIENALNNLTEIWINADSNLRKEINSASKRIDAELKSDPFRLSESGDWNTRVILIPPLGILFEIDAGQRMVSILRVWQIKSSH